MSLISDVHVEYIRPKYSNLEIWCQDVNNTYVGRKGIIILNGRRFPNESSIQANPFKVGKDGDLQTVLNKYYEYITKKIIDENLWNELRSLRGKNLGCWCVKGTLNLTDPLREPWICHGQILLFLVNWDIQNP